MMYQSGGRNEVKIPGFIRILRPGNAIIAGLAAILGYFIAAGIVVPGTLILFAIVFLITSGGNTINDFFDARIDRINRPDRPIPRGEVSPRQAWDMAFSLFAAGIFLSIFTNFLCMAIAVLNSLLLTLYAYRLKRTVFIGNAAVSYLSGSIFLFGGAYLGIEGAIRVAPVAVITFFAMISRELLKAAEDIEGDAAAGAITVPVRFGIRNTEFLSIIAAGCAIAASAYPLVWWGLPYLAGIAPVDAVILAAVLLPARCRDPACIRRTKATTLLKYGMFASLVVFTLAAFLA
jgi:geranylgeranylglycerol-phosphate geranylgeranyltransferase